MDEDTNKQRESLLQYLNEEQSEEHTASQETHSRPAIHVYLTDEPDEPEEEVNTIESTIEDTTDDVHPAPAGMKMFPRAPYAPRMSKRTIFITVLLVCLLAVGGSVIWSLVAMWTPQAMITLVPVTTEISMTSNVAVTTTAAVTATENHVAGRLLSSLTLSQQQSVPTTGRGHQAARAAQGTLTFYNALPQAQTIPAGQLLTDSGGMQVITDQDAVIPASVTPTEGQVTVSAHAVQTGPQGNIQADALNTVCCRAYVLVKNTTAFTGGQEARAYPMVMQHDIDSAVTFLKNNLEQSEQAASQSHVHPDETLLTPLACIPQVTTDTHAGEEASTVTVTLDERCRAVTYNSHAMRLLVTQSLNQQAGAQLGGDYRLTGEI